MKYIMFSYGTQADWDAIEDLPTEVAEAEYGPVDDVAQELIASGEHVYAAGLADPSHTHVVELREGAPVVTDGPYAEAKEFLASFGVVDVESLDRALEIAARVAATLSCRVEVRPLMGDGGLEM
ncbi:MAG: YciI family protein [Nocardioidaceae bacterium]